MTFTRKILLGLLAGVTLGLFFGESVGGLSVVGDVYIGLLQMTVLPYIMLSLIANLGRISWSESRGLLTSLCAVFLVFLLGGGAILMLSPLAFPPADAASFFSRTLIEAPEVIDFVALYVPSNPFSAMADNLVPAVVLFSILLGIGLSGAPHAGGLLTGLDTLTDALNRVNKLVIKLTPLGVFAIAAGTAGTMSLDELGRLQGFLISYTLLVAAVTFVVLPLLVSAVTPFSPRELLMVPRDSLITIFAAAKIIVLMPQLIENVQELFRRHDLLDEEVEHGTGILMPLAYPFPNLGTYLILSFVAFAGWYLGRPLDFADTMSLEASSFFSSFVAPIVGIPFLLDMLQLPADVMELFVVSTVYTDRIRVVLGAMHLIALSTVVMAIRRGVFRPDFRKLAIALAFSVVAVGSALMLTRFWLQATVVGSYDGDQQLLQIEWMARPVIARSYSDELPSVAPTDAPPRLTRISERGTVRVGYVPDSLPWAFRNEQGIETGFDMEMANALARDLDVSLELVRVREPDISALIGTGQIDIVMSGLGRTADRLRLYRFAGEPIDLTLGLLVPDHERKAFSDSTLLRARTDLTIGVVQRDPAFQRQIGELLPNASIKFVNSPRAFLRGDAPDLDTVLYSAEGGAAWTLLYPNYSVVVPQPVLARLTGGYIVPVSDDPWARYINEWVKLKRRDGTVDALFEHWIGGGGATPSTPRWSVARDVLGWDIN
ncbi:cation:dicarboxylase symporter family transporter [Congregibacter brevis]|uniref:Cation:dicarboxylase symporter family transporter n=1 Tax=Congregibacter brevis TaxID=3081201 RepID=A0ABZ0IE89_9GAMM|nr:cation:dicarboxylase symporter family transporter [Congregibacter sp. IMCC45268]